MADLSGVATATSSGNRKVWKKSAYDVADQTTSNATDLGYLRKNDSRVNIISTMDANIKKQVFSFKNMSDTHAQLLQQSGADIRVKVLNQAGQVIADSKSGMGKASQAYQSMTKGTYDLKQGLYYISVERGPKAPVNTKLAYTVQVNEGSTVKNDYITQAIPEPAKITQQKALAAVQQIPTNALANTGLLGGTLSDPYGLGGYNIFGQKTSG